MAVLRETLSRSSMSGADIDWVHRLVGDWQMLADLAFADLTLWLPVQRDDAADPHVSPWFLAAHARPSTGPNFYHDDVIGETPGESRQRLLAQVMESGRPVTPDEVGFVREQYVPVVRTGRPIAVLVRHTDLQSMRQQGGLEVNYLQISQQLFSMIAEGAFPMDNAATGVGRGTPRVGDGVLRLTADGVIDYASPNAVSALRRLGHTDQVNGADLAQIVTARLARGSTVDETVPLVLTGRAPWGTEIETGAMNLTLRSVPLTRGGERVGALLLMRDVSEIRRRERELLSKEATIREIHHRVKNNLQTVAALLRLQSRRLDDPKAQEALAEAGRRLSTVALVHDTLSQGFSERVDFDDVATRTLRATVEVASTRSVVEAELEGSFGWLPPDDATHLAMILAELVHNAVEHGFEEGDQRGDAPRVVVRAHRTRDAEADEDLLEVEVADNGSGYAPASAARQGLGTQIVEALISDLRGRISWETAKPHGTVVRFTVRLRGSVSG
ncbi:Serine phosphatase RsbU, regulator of sigma subunit [Serinicoccus hydrothermalis]|uniref:histidine kinase n=1 Tax=Serinicoccus hydrothermalis TaxID=1758689 RepID=A0A1B1NAD7_9MICO|nr:sensor histidine kinase [Serinicoccus hydrothermalis]ANS78396.1 Serine phosphatase RsbU, regulator of sigma subunit [Serinicoccus hydrothermalis]